MTDITPLTQSEINDALAQLKQISEYPTPSTQYARVLRKYIATLVEALEKAQGMEAYWKTQCRGITDHCEELQARIAELESFRTAYMEWSDKTDWVQKDKRFDVLKPWGKHRADVLKEYIQHLESRAVKLPKPYAYLRENDGQIQISIGAERPSDRSGGYATPWFAIYTAAGIKVEADSLDADVSNRNQPGMVVAVHIDVGDFVKFRGQVYEVKETDFDDHDVTLWFVCGEVLKCAAGCPIEVVSAPVEDE